MYKIQVQNRSTFLAVFILVLLITLFIAGVVFLVLNPDFKNPAKIFELIFFLLFLIPFLFTSYFNKKPYVSDLIFSDDNITFVIKVRDKEIKRKIVNKSDIKSFNLEVSTEVMEYGRRSCITTKASVKVNLSDGTKIDFDSASDAQVTPTTKKLIFELIRISPQIPNFKYKILGDNNIVKKEIEYYIKNGKKMPLSVRWKETPTALKVAYSFIFVALLGLLFSLTMLVYGSLPAPKLSDNELQHMTHYNNAIQLRTKNKDYKAALIELDKAEEYLSAESGVYLERAYNYKKLKRYDEAIESALKGLEFTSTRPIRYKYHNYRFLNKNDDDIYLYIVLGECYMKKNDYANMYNAYNYLVENKHHTYADYHFWRGYALYYQGKLQEAKNDFISHKAIIEKYFDYQANTEYKDYYPIYTENDINNVQAWLDACDKYMK